MSSTEVDNYDAGEDSGAEKIDPNRAVSMKCSTFLRRKERHGEECRHKGRRQKHHCDHRDPAHLNAVTSRVFSHTNVERVVVLRHECGDNVPLRINAVKKAMYLCRLGCLLAFSL